MTKSFRDFARGLVPASIRTAASRSPLLYRLSLVRDGAAFRPPGRPDAPWWNAVLRTRQEANEAVATMRRLRLPRPHTPEKCWDSLAMLDVVLRSTRPDAAVLDAGAEHFSALLPSLFLYGYRRLTGVNLSFPKTVVRGGISYEPGDITRLKFADASFDAAACQSVIEHGVPLDPFFTEMFRVLRPGSLLTVSTDYWDEPIDATGKTAWGAPVHIFTRDEIERMLRLATARGFDPTGPMSWTCRDRPVSWLGLDYTFIVMTFRRRDRPPHAA